MTRTIAKVFHYSMYPIVEIEAREAEAIKNRQTSIGFYVSAKRDDGGRHLELYVGGMYHAVVTRAEVEAVRNMLSEALADWPV